MSSPRCKILCDYLEKVKALVTTGPTGTNVMDLVLAIKL